MNDTRTMTADDIVKAVKMALNEHQSEFWVDAEKHYLHHKAMDVCQESKPEWEANHALVSSVRAAGATAKTVTVSTSIRVLLVAVFGIAWYAITHFFTTR